MERPRPVLWPGCRKLTSNLGFSILVLHTTEQKTPTESFMAEPEPKVRKTIAAAGQMKKLMADHFLAMDAAKKEGKPKVAWCTSVGRRSCTTQWAFSSITRKIMRAARRYQNGNRLTSGRQFDRLLA